MALARPTPMEWTLLELNAPLPLSSKWPQGDLMIEIVFSSRWFQEIQNTVEQFSDLGWSNNKNQYFSKKRQKMAKWKTTHITSENS